MSGARGVSWAAWMRVAIPRIKKRVLESPVLVSTTRHPSPGPYTWIRAPGWTDISANCTPGRRRSAWLDRAGIRPGRGIDKHGDDDRARRSSWAATP